MYITDYNEETSNRLIYDEERKYGKIPAKIYLLYLKSCGLWTIGVFCGSAVAWQATKIYLDVWLRDWTDIEQTNRFTDVRIRKHWAHILSNCLPTQHHAIKLVSISSTTIVYLILLFTRTPIFMCMFANKHFIRIHNPISSASNATIILIF